MNKAKQNGQLLHKIKVIALFPLLTVLCVTGYFCNVIGDWADEQYSK